MRRALTLPSPGGGAAIASAAGIVVWNPSGLLSVRSRLDVNPTVPPLSPER